MISEVEALKTIAENRGDRLFVTTITSESGWHEITTGELEVPFLGNLGGGSSFGLGLALARPDIRVVVLEGDGGLLMNLGSLVTIANMAPPNLVYFVFENGVWESSGGQPLVGAGKVSFVGFAKAAGIPKAYEFDDIDEFRRHVENILSEAGPTLVCLKVARDGNRSRPSRSLSEGFPRLKAALEKYASQA